MNLTDHHIHHPQLGQVETGGDRFRAILRAAARLRTAQESEANKAAVLARIKRRVELAAVIRAEQLEDARR